MWKAIPGYEGLYEISESGEVASLNYNKTGERKTLKLGDSRGYATVELTAKRFTVHRLVMLTFVGPRPDGYQINHIDGNKKNNHRNNLEYCTPSANQKHSFVIGLQDNRGESHSQNKLKNADVLEIRMLLKEGYKQGTIAKHFGVNQAVISNIKNNKAWSHV